MHTSQVNRGARAPPPPPPHGYATGVTYSIKDSAGNILADENEILSRWREYFEDLLNPVKASNRDPYKVIHLGEDEVFTAAEVATPIKGIKP